MYELYEVNTDKLLCVGSVDEIAKYTGFSISSIRTCSITGAYLHWQYYVIYVGRKKSKCKQFDVYQGGVLVDEGLSARDIADKYYLSVHYVHHLCKLGRETKDGISIKESTENE